MRKFNAELFHGGDVENAKTDAGRRRTDVGTFLAVAICRKRIGDQAIVSTTPPSTRKAAPVVADA